MATPKTILSRLTSHVSLPSPSRKSASLPSTISSQELEFHTNDMIDKGNFGAVYFGKVRELSAAIKILNDSKMTQSAMETFAKEVEIVKNNSHPNIVRYLGVCVEPGQFGIVMEYVSGGNLFQLLQDDKRKISNYQLMRIAKEVALGMNWLHSSQPPIIHRDLKLTNVLLDGDLTAKLCDFGLAQEKLSPALRDPSSGARGTPLWMAPEVLRMEPFDEKSDVYSMGLILWSLVTRREPYSEYRALDPFFQAVCERHERPKIPVSTLPRLTSLIEACWDPKPQNRPNFPEIIHQLNHILIETAILDPAGRAFWSKYCVDQQYIYWNDFVDCFLEEFVYLEDKATMDDIDRASLLQLAEFSSRAVRNAQIVGNEIDRRYGSRDIAEQLAQEESHLQTLIDCAKALLSSERGGEDMITTEQFGDILQWFGPLVDNDGSSHFLDRIGDILSHPSFHGFVSAGRAQELLHGHPEGVYLIRFSSLHGQYTISYTTPKGINHTRIIHHRTRGFEFRERYHESLGSLVTAITPTLQLSSPCPGSQFRPLFAKRAPVTMYKNIP